MRNPREIFNQAQSLLRQGDMAGVDRVCRAGLEKFPADANLMVLAARANLALREFEKARSIVQGALDAHPAFAGAHDALGDILLVEGKHSEALKSYERALELEASRASTRKKLEKARQFVERGGAVPAEAMGGRKPAARKQMAFAEQMRQAEKFEKEGNRKEAESIYRSILKKDPDHVEASRLLAGIAVSYEQYKEAIVFLRRAVELAPDYVRAWVDLANAQRQYELFDDAEQSASRVVELAPDRAESYMLYASVVGVAGHHNAAIEAYRKAIERDPEKAGAMCSMAHHLKTIGKQEDAIAWYRRSIEVRPDHAESYWSLANLKTFRFEESEVEAMLRLLEEADLGDESRAQIHNALGLDYEGRGAFERAFEHFSLCNMARRKSEYYDPVETEDTHDRVIGQFDKAFLAKDAGPPVDPTPIFVVGLPRSGSTLIEQILASHSLVDGTHELSDLSKVLRAMRRGRRREKRFPEVIAGLNARGWARIGEQYLERTEKYRSGAPYFIDKNPNNFIFIGLIRLAMPNAKIINARRHPLDSCLGSFKQLFASGQPFSYDMSELGEYYLQYLRLMDHWHRVLPGFVLDMHYEDVVGDLEGQVARLLEFCSLPFEESCIRFYETRRAVKTASSEQVRQPIYSTSVHLWRNYERQLADLVEILAPVLPQTDR